MRRLISSGSPFEADIGYSRAVVDGDWIFVSGTTGFNYDAMTISPDVREQAEQTMQNMGRALTEAGSSFAEVVRVRYILPNAADFEPCWPVMRRYFGEVRPAATMIAAGLSDPRMKIEIEVTARRVAKTNAQPSMSLTETIDTYCAAWNEVNAKRRAELLSCAVTTDLSYIDPSVEVMGVAALVQHIDQVLLRYPHSSIMRTSNIDLHHDWARFAFKRVLSDGSSLPEGVDIVEAGSEGKLHRIVGFFGPLKASSI